MLLLLHPLALIGLATVPLLVLVYVLRNRFRPRTVSSLMLWRLPVQPRSVGARREKLRLPWLFWLELLTLVLLVLAAAGPEAGIGQGGRPWVVVLDDSVSMRARSDHGTARDRAVALLEAQLRERKPSLVRFILAGVTPRMLEGTGAGLRDIRSRLEGWSCAAPAADLERAIGLAAEWARNRADVVVLTDHAPPDGMQPGEGVLWYAVGQRRVNAGFVGAARTAAGDRDRCFVEILNGAADAHRTELIIRLGQEVWDRKSLALAPGERHRLVFEVPAGAPVLTAELGPDALDEDNLLWLAPPPRRKVNVAVALTNQEWVPLIERTLKATGLSQTTTNTPDLVIFQGEPRPWPARTWTLRWVEPGQPALFTGPFLLDRAHPLAQGLSLEGTLWAGPTSAGDAGGVPVVLAGNTPLLTESVSPDGTRHLELFYEPAHSTLHESPDWPVLFWNLLNWRAEWLPGLREPNVRVGAEVIVRHEGAGVRVRGPAGWERTMETAADPFVFEPPRSGLYEVTSGAWTEWLAVNLLAEGETDLSACTEGTWGAWRSEAAAEAHSPWPTWLGLAACAALLAHLYLVTAERRSVG
ncbi:MAG: hypothetical protein KatS3mg132_450 [Limisphaera sp.]|nr:MAG: hypothetical protein KatS3mg132_450 [Limisphaera sp.]